MVKANEVKSTARPAAPMLVALAGTADVVAEDAASMERVGIHACVAHLEGTALGFRAIDNTEVEDTLLAFTQSVRDNGYDMGHSHPRTLRAQGGYNVGPNAGRPGKRLSARHGHD